MLLYWSLFLFFLIGAFSSQDGPQSRASFMGLWFGAVLLTVAIGLRFKVGGDWGTYQIMFRRAAVYDFQRMLQFGDPAYQLLNWVVQWLEWPFWVVNLVCAGIFCWGLTRFAMTQINPWLAMVVAVPYLVIVVSMGYTRQSVAIGIIMMGLSALQRGRSVIRFSLYVLAAALFHKTAVVAMLLVALTGKRNRVVNLMIVVASAVLLYDSLLQGSMNSLMRNYVVAKYESQGAAIRIGLCIVPAAIFFISRKKLFFSEQGSALWRNFSITALLSIFALIVSPSSTAVDRISLYLLPLQIAVISQIPRVLSSSNGGKLLVAAYAFAIQFTWLNFATNASYWVPYRSYLNFY